MGPAGRPYTERDGVTMTAKAAEVGPSTLTVGSDELNATPRLARCATSLHYLFAPLPSPGG